MKPRIIKTSEQYRRYLAEAAKLGARDPEARSKEGGRLELLAKLIEDFEKERYNFRNPDPVEAIVFRMQQQGLRQKDIADLLGGKNRASEVLSRKRPLTLPMIRAVYVKLDIPAELFMQLKALPLRRSGVSPAIRSTRRWGSATACVEGIVEWATRRANGAMERSHFAWAGWARAVVHAKSAPTLAARAPVSRRH